MSSKEKKAGVETVSLIPLKKGSGVKSVTLEIDSKTMLPRTIKLTPTTGGNIVVTLSNVKLNGGAADSAFEYPKSKYPSAQIIDMR